MKLWDLFRRHKKQTISNDQVVFILCDPKTNDGLILTEEDINLHPLGCMIEGHGAKVGSIMQVSIPRERLKILDDRFVRFVNDIKNHRLIYSLMKTNNINVLGESIKEYVDGRTGKSVESILGHISTEILLANPGITSDEEYRQSESLSDMQVFGLIRPMGIWRVKEGGK